MHHRAHAADALRPDPCFPRIASLQDHLNAAEHRSGTPRVGNFSAAEIGFDAQMAFNAADRIDNEACHVSSPSRPAAVRAPPRFDHFDKAVGRDAGGDCADHAQTDFTRGDFHAEPGHVRQAFVERRHVIQKRGEAQAIQPWPARMGQLV